jgi:ketosteroid isomerase-like protein
MVEENIMYKNFFTTIVLAAIVLLFISCENKDFNKVAEKKETSKPNISLQEEIDSINNILDKAMLSGNFEAMLPYYAEDIIVSPGLNPTAKGKTAIKESYEKNRKDGVKYHSFSGTTEEIWECGDRVYERGTFGMSFSYKDHPKPIGYYGSYFTIWQRDGDGSLKIKYVIWNLGFNPC